MHREAQNCACFNLRAASRSVTKRYDEILEPSGLLSTQYSMLSFIDAMDQVGMADVARWMVMDISTVTRNLQPLVAGGYATVRPSPADRRRKIIRVTAKGRRALSVARPLWRRAQDQIVAEIGAARYEALLSILAHFREHA